jgi:preprotein translocase subunit SecG
MTGLLFTTITLFVLVAVILILLVLIQKGRGGGLATAFGGGGGNTAFGSKTGDVLTWATSIVFGIFLLLAVALSLVADRVSSSRVPAGGGGAAQSPANRPAGAPSIPAPPMPQEPAGNPLPSPR